MDLSNMTWCPPMYVTLSMLATFGYPVLVLPVFLSRDVWNSFAPALIAVFPILGNLVVAYLLFADALRGAAIGGASIAPVAAGISVSQRPLLLASLVAFSVSTMGLIIATVRSRASDPRVRWTTPVGRRSVVVVISTVFVLTVPQATAASWIRPSTLLRLEKLPTALEFAAVIAGLMLILAVALVRGLVRSSRRAASANPFWVLQVRSLLLSSFVSLGVGVAAFLVHEKF